MQIIHTKTMRIFTSVIFKHPGGTFLQLYQTITKNGGRKSHTIVDRTVPFVNYGDTVLHLSLTCIQTHKHPHVHYLLSESGIFERALGGFNTKTPLTSTGMSILSNHKSFSKVSKSDTLCFTCVRERCQSFVTLLQAKYYGIIPHKRYPKYYSFNTIK